MPDQPLIPFRDHVDFRFNRIEKELCDLEDHVRGLETSRAQLAGKADSQAVNRVLLISLTSLILAAIGLVLRFMGV